MVVQSKLKRLISRILKGVGVTLLTAIVAGVIYEEVGRRQDRKRLPQIGQSVDIGGRSMNIYCSGEGSPVVIFDPPGNEPGYHWSHIQPEIAKFTRACWYDRAGTGWSDPGPYPRTSLEMAKELHELLNRAGVPAPYVLVGASSGGLNARVYNGLFMSEVAGMVLVDASLLGNAAWPDSLEQARSAGGLGDRPLIVLTAGRAPIPLPGEPEMDPERIKDALAYHQVWMHELQAQFVKLSTRGRQIIVKDSRHAISDEAPDAVINAVREVVTLVRVDRSKSSATPTVKK